jgi:hypothetical protein
LLTRLLGEPRATTEVPAGVLGSEPSPAEGASPTEAEPAEDHGSTTPPTPPA